jgi:hypothetical protein
MLAPVATSTWADACLAGLAPQVARCVGKLGEDQHLVFAMDLRQQFAQGNQLVVAGWVPIALAAQQLASGFGCLAPGLPNLLRNKLGRIHLKSAFVFGGVLVYTALARASVSGTLSSSATASTRPSSKSS